MSKLTLSFIFYVLPTVLAASCSTSPTGRKQLILVKDAEMSRMGVAAFDEMKTKTPIDRDAATNAYVQCVARAVAREAAPELPDRSWEIVVFKDKTANAFALPGGKIGVHTGILPVANTPAQLAAVLGHEVGHVLARHGAERVSQGIAAQSGLVLADALLGKEASPQTRQYTMAALGLGAQFGVLLPFGRRQETEADEMGLLLMARAGFNPEESIQLWQNMAQASGGKSPPEWLSTHPSNSSRIEGLNAHMAEAKSLYAAAVAQGKTPNCRR